MNTILFESVKNPITREKYYKAMLHLTRTIMLIEIPKETDFKFVITNFDKVLHFFDTLSKSNVHRYCIIISNLIKCLDIEDEDKALIKESI